MCCYAMFQYTHNKSFFKFKLEKACKLHAYCHLVMKVSMYKIIEGVGVLCSSSFYAKNALVLPSCDESRSARKISIDGVTNLDTHVWPHGCLIGTPSSGEINMEGVDVLSSSSLYKMNATWIKL